MKTNTIIIFLILFCIFFALILSYIFFADTENHQELKKYIENSLAQGHKIIIVPEGKYFVDGIISIDSKYSETKVIAENENVKIISSQIDPVFLISDVKNFELSGFTFKSVIPQEPESIIGFYFQEGASDWTNGATAIWIEDSSHVNISRNYINGYWMGVYITVNKKSTSHINVVNNEVTNCGYWSIAARYPIHQNDLIEKRLQYISFLENNISKSEQGPVFKNVNYGIMKENKVFNNIIGIRIEQSQFCVIENNDVSKNLQSGIFIYNESHHNSIVKNTIHDNNLQAAKIQSIAKDRNCDEKFLPGDIERFEKHPENLFKEYDELVGDPKDMLAYEPEFWPYPTAYDFITPSNRVKNHLDPEINEKFWGLYFSQWGGVGIELRSESSYNLIEHNKIFNSDPLNINDGYMIYGVKINHLMGSTDVSKFNIIRDNDIRNMVKGLILDVNKRHGIE